MSITPPIIDSASTVVYLAGLGGDGTSNGAVSGIVNRVLGMVSVVAVAIFAVRIGMTFAKKPSDGVGADTHKDLVRLGFQFVIVMVLIFGAWSLAKIGASLAGGTFS